MHVGETVDAYIELKNIGTATWDSNTRLATTQPRDRASVFVGPEWSGDNRYAAVQGTVAPGSNYKFTFKLHAPDQTGTYDEHFGVVQEGTAWFSDAGQGGPADDQLEGVFEVIPAAAGAGGTSGASGTAGTNGSSGSSAQAGSGGAGADGGSAGAGGDGDIVTIQFSRSSDSDGSCAISSRRATTSAVSSASFITLALLALRRRQRTR